MNPATQIERDLYNYLSPEGKAKAEKHYAALETENADESANEKIELGDEAIELMVREPKVEPDEDDLRDEERERRIRCER